MRTAPKLRGGFREDRIAGGGGELGDGLGESRHRLAAGNDQAARCTLDPLGQGVEQPLVGAPAKRRTVVERSIARPSSASGSRRGHRPSTGSGASGSRQGTFRWTGPGRGSPSAVA